MPESAKSHIGTIEAAVLALLALFFRRMGLRAMLPVPAMAMASLTSTLSLRTRPIQPIRWESPPTGGSYFTS